MSELLHDDFSRLPVENVKLRPWWYLMIMEMGVMISIPVFLFGGQLGIGLRFDQLIPAAFCGAAIIAVPGMLTARLGAITRCSTPLIARLTFGNKGTIFITMVIAIAMTGWWGVQTEMFATAVVQLGKTLFQTELPGWLTIILGGSAMIVTVALGFRAIGKLSYIAVPLLLVGLGYALSTLGEPGSLSALTAYAPSMPMGFGVAVATVAGAFVVGAVANPDYSRYARTPAHALGYAGVDYAINYPLLLIICGVLAVKFGDHDIITHLAPASIDWIIFVMMMVATWAANDCNLYSSSLALANILPNISRPVLAIAAGMIGIASSLLHIAEHLVSFLSFLGILIAPIAGVFLADNMNRKESVQAYELAHLPDWKLAQLAAWFSGTAIGFLTMPREAFGLGLFSLTTVSTLDALLASAAIFLVFKFSHDRHTR